MKPISDRPQNRIISAVAIRADLTEAEQQALRSSGYAEVTMRFTKAARTEVVKNCADVDPSLAYGCVDWYLYPDSNRESHARTAATLT